MVCGGAGASCSGVLFAQAYSACAVSAHVHRRLSPRDGGAFGFGLTLTSSLPHKMERCAMDWDHAGDGTSSWTFAERLDDCGGAPSGLELGGGGPLFVFARSADDFGR